jgi:hypothetical protein
MGDPSINADAIRYICVVLLAKLIRVGNSLDQLLVIRLRLFDVSHEHTTTVAAAINLKHLHT